MDLQGVKAAFEHKGYTVRIFETAAQAADYLDDAIDGKSVGFGDSQTLKAMGLYERLSGHNRVVSPMHLPEGETFYTEAEKCIHTQVYLVSVNGAAQTGELVNIDGFGNRVAGSLYCHEKVYFVLASTNWSRPWRRLSGGQGMLLRREMPGGWGNRRRALCGRIGVMTAIRRIGSVMECCCICTK